MNREKIIDGKFLAQKVRQKLAEEIKARGVCPGLAVILVGDDEASLIYDRNKKKAAEAVGMKCDFYHLPETTPETELLALIDSLNRAEDVHGILVQLPLPPQINPQNVLSAISPLKDVDGFSPCNAGLLMADSADAVVAATPKGVLYMLQSVLGNLSGKHAVIIGRSNIVGKPLASLLLNHNCTVTVVHSKTENIKEITGRADILVAACGCPRMVKKDWVKKGAVVIDVGINRTEGKLCGDVDFEDVYAQASYLSPVPGGVGPLTVAMLLTNTFEAFLKQNRLKN